MNTLQDCILFANTNPICHLATCETDQPRVRVIGFWHADISGFYFQTVTTNQLYSQLQQNPLVEVCFYRSGKALGTMLRIAGKTEFISDPSVKEKVIAERPFLKSFGLSADHPHLCIFRIPHGRAHFWTMQNNLRQPEYIDF